MLRINRVKINISTKNGEYGFDTTFDEGLNFLSSEENTCGKSSIIAAIYYCMGLEEIIGGKGEKVLTSVFKTTVEDNGKTWQVLQSCAYLEISNGNDVVTLYRVAKMENRDTSMITVYYGNMNEINDPKTVVFDTYVHFPNAATNEKGFHNFLEKFLHLELPLVVASDNAQRKLYLQLIFSGMFIEQKHGWSDLFSGMPILGIKESKKRVIEFILKLDTLTNDKKSEKLKLDEASIKSDWESIYKDFQIAVSRENCCVLNYPVKPKILNETDLNRICIKSNNELIDDFIIQLEKEAEEIKQLKPKVVDNFEELQKELTDTEDSINEMVEYVSECRIQLSTEKGIIKSINDNLETIAIDLSNNKDAARLRKLGSELELSFTQDVCPVCHQKICDSLLPQTVDAKVMSIDENIKHLEAQQEMLKFTLLSHNEQKETLEREIQSVEARIFSLRRLAKTIRNDLYSINEDYSEAVVYKKITIEKKIESLNALKNVQSDILVKLKELSDRWSEYLDDKNKLPKNRFTDMDTQKIKLLRSLFIGNLKKYGYKSVQNLDEITISDESYLPLFEGFDMKFDSSASDNIRVIWAFTMALLQVSLQMNGNHPSVLIFDEPDQQSTIISDMKSFFDSIVELSKNSQVIMGITLKDSDTKNVIQKISSDFVTHIDIPNKAFQLLDK